MPRWLLRLLAAVLTFTAGFYAGCWWCNWMDYTSAIKASKGRIGEA